MGRMIAIACGCLLVTILCTGCAKKEVAPTGRAPEQAYRLGGKRYTVRDTAKGYVEYGLATWTGCDQHKTASGEPYNCDAMTAAHKSLPFGALVRVTRQDTGASTIVRINDRGPFLRGDGRIIDLSRAAAELLDMLEAGVVRVKVEGLE